MGHVRVIRQANLSTLKVPYRDRLITHETEAEWLATRKQGIGASEVGSVIGVNMIEPEDTAPRRSTFELFQEKTGASRYMDAIYLDMGHAAEPVIDKWYKRALKLSTTNLGDYTIVRDAECKRMFATPDRVVLKHPKAEGPGGMEAKFRGLYAVEAWKEGIPFDIELQVQQTMGVCEAEWWDVALYMQGFPLRVYHIERNDRLIGNLRLEIDTFWERIENMDPPPPDWRTPVDALLRAHGNQNADATEMDLPEELELPGGEVMGAQKIDVEIVANNKEVGRLKNRTETLRRVVMNAMLQHGATFGYCRDAFSGVPVSKFTVKQYPEVQVKATTREAHTRMTRKNLGD